MEKNEENVYATSSCVEAKEPSSRLKEVGGTRHDGINPDLRSLTTSHAVLRLVHIKPSFTSLHFLMIHSDFACLTRSYAMRRDAA